MHKFGSNLYHMTKLISSIKKTVAQLMRSAGTRYFNRQLKKQKLSMLFVLGHMRSGSSLLLHLLNSNPEIIGYGETHHTYFNPTDFGKSVYDIFFSFKKTWKNETYVLDKVLHNGLLRNPQLLHQSKILFLVRDAESTLPSLLKLNLPFIQTPEQACTYYTERLAFLTQMAQQIPPRNWIYFTYTELVNNTPQIFTQIQTLLHLKQPLKEEYDVIWSTGKKNMGDSSTNINSGKITPRQAAPLDPAFLPYLPKSEAAYQQCLQTLAQLKQPTPHNTHK